MKIKNHVIKKLKESKTAKLEIALSLGVSEQSARRYLDQNSDELTKAAALAVICRETGLRSDQVLESSSEIEKIK